ncbi:hypothetical protein C6495_07480 [Candidatus Poribacteria bacterium]|nr:MAG: hypothetical protein C6495_07480 [Candidatus Poribacteria bacterium]
MREYVKTVPEVLEQFQIRYTRNDFVNGEPLTPSEQFLQELAFNQQYFDIFASEAIRCQAFIFPVLRESYKRYAKDYALWIGKSIAYDETLTGTPDYLVSTRAALGPLLVGHPLIMLVEAKKNDFDMGWGQCLAELVAAQKINDDADIPVYGIVTDGKSWEFGRLVGDGFTQNITPFLLANLPELFGALNAVFKAATEAATPNA